MLMISYAEYDMICLHKSLIIVLRWFKSFFVLRYNDNVILKSLCNHDVIDIVTRIVCIMRYESSNRETIFFQLIYLGSMKMYLISWLYSSTAVKNRLIHKPWFQGF